jgi:hypothetical protein
MKPQPCLSWDEAPALIKVAILDILGPRVPILDSVPDVPKTHGYVYLTFFCALWRRGAKRFAYIGKKSAKADLFYRGTGQRGEFEEACAECPPCDTVKVFLGVVPRGRPLSRLEFALQRRVGIPDAGTDADIDHHIWLNRYAYGGDNWTHMTPEQRSAGGKITGPIAGRRAVESGNLARIASAGGKIGGKITGKIAGKINGAKTGPAAMANMKRRLTDLRSTNDPEFWSRFAASIGLPLVPAPAGWKTQSNATRFGFDIAPDMVVVPVGVPAPHRDQRSGAKKNAWMLALYERGVSTFAQCVEDRARLYPGDKGYGSPNGAKNGLSRESLRGLFSICCPETGRVLRGPGSDQPTLRHTGAGWRRGRVVSRGPYGLPGGPLLSP